MSTIKLDFISASDAEKTVKRWHYSKTMPVSRPIICIGAWENGKYVGCVIFSPGAAPKLGSPYGLHMFECTELVRVALCRRETSTSKILAIALRLVKKHSPGIRLIVSFADPVQQHMGTIYQATNWVYAGTSSPSTELRLNGKRMNRRAYTGVNFGNSRLPIPKGAVWVDVPGKHRYLFPMDDEMRERIAPLSQPYPKRQPVGVAGVHPAQGGASPTLTLHPREVPDGN